MYRTKPVKLNYLGKGSPHLLHRKVPVHSRSRCLKEVHGMITKFGICAGGKGPDTCQGDSGGPLVCRINDGLNPDHSRYALAGVTSWGLGCGESAGVYANVPEYIQWINDEAIF